MAKRSKVSRANKSSLEDEAPKKVSSGVKVQTVPLRLRIPVRYIAHGSVTGNRYEWARAGDVVLVDSRDANTLLAKVRKNLCCSGTETNVFEIGD